VARFPAEHLLEEGPCVLQGGRGGVVADMLGDNQAIGLGLPRRREAQLLEQDGRDDQADRLDVVQPFQVGIALELGRHAAHPEAGQR
jgi:hypothetical protein